MAAADSLVALGVVARPHGVQGEFRVKLYNASSGLLLEQQEVVLRSGQAERKVRVVSIRMHTNGVALMRVENCNSRSDAEQARGAEVCIPRGAFPELREGEYYQTDLIGATVLLPDGARFGIADRVISYPAADVLRVISDLGSCEVPLREPYLVGIDLARGQVVVDRVRELEWEPPRRPRDKAAVSGRRRKRTADKP